MNSPRVETPPARQLLLSVAALSAASLSFEVSLTRLFAVLLRYHFAFLVISIALCGLGVGGYLAQWLRRRRAVSLPTAGLLYAGTTVLSLVLILHVVFRFFPQAYWLAAILVLIPFTFAGIFLAEAFARYPQWSGRLYAWDLAGAALAAIGTVGVLQVFGAINACLIAAAAGSLAALLAASMEERRGASAISIAPIVLLILPLTNGKGQWLDIPAVPPKPDENRQSLADRGFTQPLFTELATPGHTSRIVDTRWNAFARTDVVADTIAPDSYLVYTNGNVPTNMMRWDGDRGMLPQITAEFPLTNWIFAYASLGSTGGTGRLANPLQPLKPQGDVLSIGPGGGLDALMALRYGAANFEGAEINPSIVGLMHDYRGFNGGIYDVPNIHVRTADGRDAVRQAIHQGKRYSLLYSALTKTATAGQGMALLESFIYTQDAFADYWHALADDGRLAVVTDQPILLARLFSTSLAMLRTQGIDEKEACLRIALARITNDTGPDAAPTPYKYAFILSKAPFTDKQTFAMSDSTTDRGLVAIWLPGRNSRAEIGPYPSVAGGTMNLEQFVAWWRDPQQLATIMGEGSLPLDVSPCPDDRPFVLDLNVEQPAIVAVYKQLAAVATFLGLLLAALNWKDREDNPTPSSHAAPLSRWLYILYFTCLGIGFMLVEIPLTQKLILPLGYPTLALTVILFSVLLGGGAGSWFSQRMEGVALRSWAVACALAVTVLAAATGAFSGVISEALLGLSLSARCLIVGLGLLPFGFFLGAPFPSGMRLFARNHAHNVPLVWGLNGIASVVGSLGAALGAKNWGFATVLSGGALVYVLAAGLIFLAARPAPE